MAVYAGSSFTVTVETVAYTALITRGGSDRTPNDVETTTLGPVENTARTKVEDTATLDFLYDGASGFYDALYDAAGMAATPLTVVITGGGGEWTGEAICKGVSNEFPAEDFSTCQATFKFPAGLAFAAE